MRTIMLIARGTFTYAGRVLADGDVFGARAIDAAVLTYRRQAVFASRGRAAALPVPRADVCTPASDEPCATETPRRRRYKRRDLEAED